jgi:hypothetical protein
MHRQTEAHNKYRDEEYSTADTEQRAKRPSYGTGENDKKKKQRRHRGTEFFKEFPSSFLVGNRKYLRRHFVQEQEGNN